MKKKTIRKPAKPVTRALTPAPTGVRKRVGRSARTDAPVIVDESVLLSDLRGLIQSARQRVATVANSTTTLLYWHLGRRLLAVDLRHERAEYGKQILATVSRELTTEFGQAFSLRSLYRAIQLHQRFPGLEIVSTLSAQLGWSHFVELLSIKDPLARDFYAEMCRIERWDVRTLRQKIGGMLFERTALSKRPKALVAAGIATLRDGQMTPDLVFRDPYLLDLLFFHRHLRCLIAVELKLESFQPAHVGQMEFYLRWLDKHERAAGEAAPIGLILCASADVEQVELLQLDAKSIRVSEYLTELPPLPLLRARLHQAIEHAREIAARRLAAAEDKTGTAR